MILNKFRHLNYKYILGELLLIFIGVSLSLYFDNWRTNRKERQKEKELLVLLMESLQRDSVNLSNLIDINRQFYNEMTYLLDSSRLQTEPSGKTTNYLSRLNLYLTYEPDLTAYENIKQEGFGIIADKEIRFEIVRHYQQMNRSKFFTEWQRDNHFLALEPYRFDAFETYNFGIEAIPEDFGNLKRDKKFWRLLSESKRIYGLTTENAVRDKERTIRFIHQIEQSIEK